MYPTPNSLTYGGEPGELKHLSTREEKKETSISKVAASEMEGASNQHACMLSYGLQKVTSMLVEWFGKASQRG